MLQKNAALVIVNTFRWTVEFGELNKKRKKNNRENLFVKKRFSFFSKCHRKTIAIEKECLNCWMIDFVLHAVQCNEECSMK